MADDAQHRNPSFSQRLYLEQGWRQGTVFVVRGALVLSNKLGQEGHGVLTGAAPVSDDELLVLVTQDCDIVSDSESHIEALVCREMSEDAERARMRSVLRDSAREFVLDWDRGLVADARRRVVFDKHALAVAEQSDWVMSAETRRDFSNWLAWRFTRPAVEPEYVKGIQEPIKDALQKLEKKAPASLAAFADATRELRIRYPATGQKEAVLFLILEDGELTPDKADAITFVCDELRLAVQKAGSFQLISHPEEYSVVLLRAYEATQPLRFDYLTRWGDELTTPTGVLRTLPRN
jgi:hypothetical protein